MRILSIDPALSHSGIVILQDKKLVHSETIKTKSSEPLIQRLKMIRAYFDTFTTDFDVVLIEMPDVFMRMGDYAIKNVRDIQVLMLAIGVITASLIRYNVDFIKVSEWKGKADKKITQLIAYKECGTKLNTHESDAYVMALRWLTVIRYKRLLSK